jgi:hypothetical protein
LKGCRSLSDQEQAQILKSFVGLYAHRDRALFLLGRYTGARISQLLYLKVSHVYQHGVAGAIAGKFTVSWITEKFVWMAAPIFIRKIRGSKRAAGRDNRGATARLLSWSDIVTRLGGTNSFIHKYFWLTVNFPAIAPATPIW